MGGSTAGARLNKTPKEGQELLDKFFGQYTGVKEAIEYSQQFLKDHSYVEDFIGRQRHLKVDYDPTEFTADKNGLYEISLVKPSPVFNPFLNCEDETSPVDIALQEKWVNIVKDAIEDSQKYQTNKANSAGKEWAHNGEMSNARYKQLAAEAIQEGVVIKSNSGKRAKALRQCFNARIQGSAASLTKMAMIDIFRDERLRAMEAHLIITVHDEVLVECPEIYADEVEKILPEIMVNAAKKGGDNVPQACDPYNVSRWYCDEYAAAILDEFSKLEKKGLSKEEALAQLYKSHSEVPQAAILKTVETGCDLEF